MKNIKIFRPWTVYALPLMLAVFIAIAIFVSLQVPAEAWPRLLKSEKSILLLMYLMTMIVTIIMIATYHIQISDTQLSRHVLLGKICFQRINFADIKSIEVLVHLPAARHAKKIESRILEITTRQHTRIKIPLMLFKNADLLLDLLHQYVEFDKTPIRPHLPAIATNDIGQRVLYLLALAIILAVSAMILSGLLLKSLHFGNEPYWYLLLLIPLLWFPCFSIIKAEHKAYPLPTTVISVAVLALCIYFSMIQLNRYLTEQQSQTTMHAFKLVHADDKHQEWTAAHALIDLKTEHNQTLYVYKTWKDGFNPNLKTGKTYRLSVQKGWLNDMAFSPRSFHEAVLIDK